MMAISDNRTPHDSHPAPSLAVTVASGAPLNVPVSVTDLQLKTIFLSNVKANTKIVLSFLQ